MTEQPPDHTPHSSPRPPVSRRGFLAVGAAGAAVTAGLTRPGLAAAATAGQTSADTSGATSAAGGAGHGGHGRSVRFTMNATVLDGGEQITAVTLHTADLGVSAAGIGTDTFRVHAKATSPIPVDPADIASEYDLDRVVTGVRVERGNIVLELAYGEGTTGAGTLGYINSKGRNVLLDLVYTITQQAPIRLRNGRRLTLTSFRQGRLSDPEVDAFSYHVSRSGMNYRLYSPHRRRRHPKGRRDRRPLVVWLHGGGEGGLLEDGYYDNEATLRANRGALGFATRSGQRILDDAYVVAPQSQSFWLEDGDAFAPQIRQIIADLVRRLPIDTDRIYVVGCSNGGYMSLKMTIVYPKLFAASVPICSVIGPFQGAAPVISDAELRAIDTPTWLVASADDPVVDPQANTVHAAELIPDAELSLYDTVTWNGYRFLGHFSWIYVARNDPKLADGTHIWQWIAEQEN